MLSLHDCIAMSDLSEDEVAIIAEHEHLSMIVATELGNSLLQSPKGILTLRGWIVDIQEHAAASGQRDKARKIDRLLSRFVASHPMPRVL